MDILDKIVAVKKEEVDRLKSSNALSCFKDAELFHQKTLSIREAIAASNDISIIAEIKKASPSKGLIREDFNPLEIAQTYFNNGASAVSVLTDEQFFQGSLNYLQSIAQIKQVPLLRKDFIIDSSQIFEARAFGADVILLIAEILSAAQIKELTQTAFELGMEVLLELHSEEQLEKIDFGLNKLIGVNNRNLKDFSVDLERTLRVCTHIPEHVQLVSESGISNRAGIEKLKQFRADAILVGEHLMRQQNIGAGLAELKGWCQRAR